MTLSRFLVAPALLAAAISCGQASGPELIGPAFFTVTLDGAPWVPDTSVGILFGETPDSGTLNMIAIRVLPAQEEAITLAWRGFPIRGTIALGDTAFPATGVFSITHLNAPGLPPPIETYLSGPLLPGTLRITGVSQTDSIVTGTFAFQAATIPDTTPHRALSGRFRVRYSFQQVYLPSAP